MLGDIWLGDAARVLAALASMPDDQMASAIEVLGFRVRREAPAKQGEAPTNAGVDVSGYSEAAADETLVAPVSTAEPSAETPPKKDQPSDVDSSVPLLEPLARQPVTATKWDVKPLPRSSPEDPAAALPHESLLAPRSS